MTTYPPKTTHALLAELVRRVRCKPSWRFEMHDDDGVRLVISVTGRDSRGPGTLTVQHYFPVPDASYNVKTWRRWIFECCRRVETHDLGEWFRDGDERPFAPLHGPGEDPYTVHEFRDVVDAHTNQEGTVER